MKYYSNLQLKDEELAELLILIEWFCISLDLLLAFDLKKAHAFHCLEELESITNPNQKSDAFFTQKSESISDIDNFSHRFRQAFLNQKYDHEVDKMISLEVIKNHWRYAQCELIPECRRHNSTISYNQAQELLYSFRTFKFTDIVLKLTGIEYA